MNQTVATMASSVFNGPLGPAGHDLIINARENASGNVKTVWPMAPVHPFQSLNNRARVIVWKFSTSSISLLAVSILYNFQKAKKYSFFRILFEY